MSLTRFPYGVSSFGAPILPWPGLVPSTTSGQGQTPGGCYFVNGDIGNDGYGGTSPQQPFKTLDRAYNACYGGRNEVIYVLGGAASVNFSSAIASGGAGLVWSKSYTHLVGLCGPGSKRPACSYQQRRFDQSIYAAHSGFGNGCYFSNVEFFNGGADATKAAGALLVTGNYNAFQNCQISGGGHATSAADNSCRSLVLTGNGTGGGGENTFSHCYIGLTTFKRGRASTRSNSKPIHRATGSRTAPLPQRRLLPRCARNSGRGWHSGFLDLPELHVHKPRNFRRWPESIYAQALAINSAPGGVLMLHNCLSGGASVSFTKFQTTASGPYSVTTPVAQQVHTA